MKGRLIIPGSPERLRGVSEESLTAYPIFMKMEEAGWGFGARRPPVVDLTDRSNQFSIAFLNILNRDPSGDLLNPLQFFGQSRIARSSRYSARYHLVFCQRFESFPSSECLADAYIGSQRYDVVRVLEDMRFLISSSAGVWDPKNTFSGLNSHQLIEYKERLEPLDNQAVAISNWLENEVGFIAKGTEPEELSQRHREKIEYGRDEKVKGRGLEDYEAVNARVDTLTRVNPITGTRMTRPETINKLLIALKIPPIG